jgi:hypothetical protein
MIVMMMKIITDHQYRTLMEELWKSHYFYLSIDISENVLLLNVIM